MWINNSCDVESKTFMNCVAEISTENNMLTSYKYKHECRISYLPDLVWKINKWRISYILHRKVQM